MPAAGCWRKFAANRNTRSHVWLRWFNEVPVLLLVAAVILVVVKPFWQRLATTWHAAPPATHAPGFAGCQRRPC